MKSFSFRAYQSPPLAFVHLTAANDVSPFLERCSLELSGPTHIGSYIYDKFSGDLDTPALGRERPRRSWRSSSPALWVLLLCTASARRCSIRVPERWADAGGG
jgi:hypothetical protein